MDPYIPTHVALELCKAYLRGEKGAVSATQISDATGIDLTTNLYIKSLLRADSNVTYERAANTYVLYDPVVPPTGPLVVQEQWLASFVGGLCEKRVAARNVRVLTRLQHAGRAVVVQEGTGRATINVWFAATIPCNAFDKDLSARVVEACRKSRRV
jgi:hypothetical protein